MNADPIEEWRRLREHYTQLSDEELYELAMDFGNLTESAQQVLRDEMKNRSLDAPRAAGEVSKRTNPPSSQQRAGSADPRSDDRQPNDTDGNRDDAPQKEYTWKTQLCECESIEQAWQIHQALQQAGIESWVEQPGSRYAISVSYPRIMVAADQLEDAVEIAGKPIPQEIIDQFNAVTPEFEPPSCPKCGAGDPVLEGVDPVNSWRCEACGKQWTEAAEDSDGNSDRTWQ
jgi:hypothetical protein